VIPKGQIRLLQGESCVLVFVLEIFFKNLLLEIFFKNIGNIKNLLQKQLANVNQTWCKSSMGS
jgi:hypothetical protein